jgi:hypothetical protein
MIILQQTIYGTISKENQIQMSLKQELVSLRNMFQEETIKEQQRSSLLTSLFQNFTNILQTKHQTIDQEEQVLLHLFSNGRPQYITIFNEKLHDFFDILVFHRFLLAISRKSKRYFGFLANRVAKCRIKWGQWGEWLVEQADFDKIATHRNSLHEPWGRNGLANQLSPWRIQKALMEKYSGSHWLHCSPCYTRARLRTLDWGRGTLCLGNFESLVFRRYHSKVVHAKTGMSWRFAKSPATWAVHCKTEACSRLEGSKERHIHPTLRHIEPSLRWSGNNEWPDLRLLMIVGTTAAKLDE